jgi:hypothetical protein
MRIDDLLHNRKQKMELDYSLLSDRDLDRCLELLKGTEYEYLNQQEQAELDEIAKKIASVCV